jgi:hypothetical protein
LIEEINKPISNLLIIKNHVIMFKQYSIVPELAYSLIQNKADNSHIKELELFILNSFEEKYIKEYYDKMINNLFYKDKFETYFFFK